MRSGALPVPDLPSPPHPRYPNLTGAQTANLATRYPTHRKQRGGSKTFVDRGQLGNLAQPTVTATGQRIPGLKLDNPRQLALMHALVRFAQIPAASTFSTAEIYPHTVAALGTAAQQYTLASLRYDLSKLRVKASSKNCPARAATVCPPRDIPSASSEMDPENETVG